MAELTILKNKYEQNLQQIKTEFIKNLEKKITK